jgi:hypothetical protein
VLSERVLVAIGSVLLLTVGLATAAAAGSTVECPISDGACFVHVVDQGGVAPSATSAPVDGGGRTCTVPRSTRSVPCTDPLWGWFNNADGCYYKALAGPLAPDNPVYEGSPDGKVVYQRQCLLPAGGSWSNVSRAIEFCPEAVVKPAR